MSLQQLFKQKVTAFKAAKARNINNPDALQAVLEQDKAYFGIASEVLKAAGADDGVTLSEKVLDLFNAEQKVIEQQLALEAELNAEPDTDAE